MSQRQEEGLSRAHLPTIGEVCSQFFGIPEREIPEIDVWDYIGGATTTGAYCPLYRKDVEDSWDRFVVPEIGERE